MKDNRIELFYEACEHLGLDTSKITSVVYIMRRDYANSYRISWVYNDVFKLSSIYNLDGVIKKVISEVIV